ncbi:MAG TPA: hypothetical protein VII59_12140 [Streptosporangiaceae bacterium]
MSDLHENLSTALGAVEPGAAPVEAAMLAGKQIRNRRRAGLLAGAVAVVVAAVVAVPAFARQEALPAPATSRIRVTVNPPGPHSPAGLIASGVVGNQRWDVVVQSPRSKSCMVTGINLTFVNCTGDLTQPDAGDPIALNGAGGGPANGTQYFVSYGPVAKDVASVRVVLADGTVLNPRPTAIDGARLVAFATPEGVPVESLTVYSRTGEIATSIPFNGPDGDGLPSFGQWLRPGQAVPARLSGTIASGTADGKPWRATVYLGPWGACVVIGPDTACFSPTQHPATAAAGGSPSDEWGTAAQSVSYLIVTPKGGTPTRVGATAVGPEKFWAIQLTKNEQMGGHFTAYNAAGQQVASGSLL